MKASRLGEFMVSGARSLLRHKLRSLLTLLGVFLGVASVITMLGIGEGAQRSVMREISGLGLNNIIAESVQPAAAQTESNSENRGPRILEYGLTIKDVRQLRSMFPDARITETQLNKARVYDGPDRIDARVIGVTPDYYAFFDTSVVAGRLPGGIDEENRFKVAVVSEDLAHLYRPVGSLSYRPLRIGNIFFEVVGVVRQAAQGGQSTIYMPYRTSRATFGTTTIKREAGSIEFTKSEVGQIIIRFEDENDVPRYADMVRRNLEMNHPQGDFKMIVPLEILETKQRTQRIFNLVLIAIAAISLVVGGIGIMNIMLAVVTERIPEIGIRRALGATRADIKNQFLAETLTLSSIGGILGCLCGFVAVPLASYFTGWEGVITPGAVIISLAVSWLVGLVFGMAPAVRASKMDVVEALRYE